MKKAIWSILSTIIIIWLLTSGAWEPIANFFVWLFTLSMTESDVSIAGEIFVKVATFGISYSLVGAIFNAIGWFDSDVMKVAYFIISTLISFALCYVVMIFETHLLLIAIIMGVILLLALAAFIAYKVMTSKKKESTKITS